MKDSAKPVMLIGGALLAGATTFLVVALFISGISASSGLDSAADSDLRTEDGTSLLKSLSLAHAVILLGALPMAFFLSRRGASSPSEPGEAAMAQRVKLILKWAPLEGAALFGIVIVLLGGLDETLREHPAYYLNLVSYGVFAVVVLLDLVRLVSED